MTEPDSDTGPRPGTRHHAPSWRGLLGRPLRGLELLDMASRRVESRHPPTVSYVVSARMRAGLLLADRTLAETNAAELEAMTDRLPARGEGMPEVGAGWLREPTPVTRPESTRCEAG